VIRSALPTLREPLIVTLDPDLFTQFQWVGGEVLVRFELTQSATQEHFQARR